MGAQEGAIIFDVVHDEVPRGRHEDRLAFRAIGFQQAGGRPALQGGGELPAEVAGVFKARIDAISAIGGMAMGGVARDEQTVRIVLVGHGHAQVPEPDVLEFAVEGGAHDLLEIAVKIEIVSRRALRHGRMEEPGLARVHPAEEAPVAVQLGMQHVEEGLALEMGQQLVQPVGAEHQQGHADFVVRKGLGQPRLFAHQRAGAVAAHHIAGAQALQLAIGGGDGHVCARRVLGDLAGGEAKQGRHFRQLRRPGAQGGLGGVLRQTLVVLKVEGADDDALIPVVMVGAQQRAIGREAANAEIHGNGGGRAHGLVDSPGVEMLHGALGQVLALGDGLGLLVALHHQAAHAALAKLDGEAHAHGPATHDHHIRLSHVHRPSRFPVHLRR